MIYVFKGRQWRPSETKDVLKGDFFFKVENEKQSPVYIAASDAYQKVVNGKKVWSVDLEKL
jgi:hypothetical protein